MTTENQYDKEGFPVARKRTVRRIVLTTIQSRKEVLCFELDCNTVAASMPMKQLMQAVLPNYKYVRPATENEFTINRKRGKLYEPVRYLQRHCF